MGWVEGMVKTHPRETTDINESCSSWEGQQMVIWDSVLKKEVKGLLTELCKLWEGLILFQTGAS